jgi:hypothetical protein
MTGRMGTNVALVVMGLLLLAGGWYGIGVAQGIRQDQREIVGLVTTRAAGVAHLQVTYTDINGDPQVVYVEGPDSEDPALLTRRLKARLAEHQREFPRRR